MLWPDSHGLRTLKPDPLLTNPSTWIARTPCPTGYRATYRPPTAATNAPTIHSTTIGLLIVDAAPLLDVDAGAALVPAAEDTGVPVTTEVVPTVVPMLLVSVSAGMLIPSLMLIVLLSVPSGELSNVVGVAVSAAATDVIVIGVIAIDAFLHSRTSSGNRNRNVRSKPKRRNPFGPVSLTIERRLGLLDRHRFVRPHRADRALEARDQLLLDAVLAEALRSLARARRVRVLRVGTLHLTLIVRSLQSAGRPRINLAAIGRAHRVWETEALSLHMDVRRQGLQG